MISVMNLGSHEALRPPRGSLRRTYFLVWLGVFLLLSVLAFLPVSSRREGEFRSFLATPFETYIRDFATCTVCHQLVREVFYNVDNYMFVKNKTFLSSYEVEDFLDPICDPRSYRGLWLRQFTFEAVKDDLEKERDLSHLDYYIQNEPNYSNQTYHLELHLHEELLLCKRSCATLQANCENMISSFAFDTFSRTISRLTKNGTFFTEENLHNVQQEYCKRMLRCQIKDSSYMNAHIALNNPKLNVRSEIEKDVATPIDPEMMKYEFKHGFGDSKYIENLTKHELLQIRNRWREMVKDINETTIHELPPDTDEEEEEEEDKQKSRENIKEFLSSLEY